MASGMSRARPDPSFVLATADPMYRAPAFIGNGAFSLLATSLGTTPAQSFAAGVYDRAPDDVPRLAVLPAWNVLDVFDGDAWLSDQAPGGGTLRSYRQALDMYDGTLHTRFEWASGANTTAIDVFAFVSRADPHLAAIRVRLVPRFAGRFTIRFALHEWPEPERHPFARLERLEPRMTLADMWYPGHIVATARTAAALSGHAQGGGTLLAIAQRVLSSDVAVPDDVDEVSFDARPGEPITFTKVVGVASTRDGSDPLPIARAALLRAVTAGYDALVAEHVAAWHRLWETDVVVEGDDDLQRLVHAMLFYLLASVRGDGAESVPPMGLSSAGYYGHVFWDADTWMFPPLLVLHPELARSIVDFRTRTLDAARRNARANGQGGAMYPWEADENGDESIPRFALQNALGELHISGDVALAAWQYYLATGDRTWLARDGYPVIKETADFWCGRAEYDAAADRYDIRGVVSVEEDLIGVDNETYTNAIARKNLELAVTASEVVGRSADPRWSEIAAKLHIPFDAGHDAHPTYENAPPDTSGAVVPLLAYPLALPMGERTKRNDLSHAVARLATHRVGPMMTITLYALVAAELGDRALVDELAPRSYEPNLRGPFLALAETPRNDAVHFLTGAGGFLQQVLFGYTGLRIAEGGLAQAHPPVLPSRVRRLVLRNVSVRGKRYDVVTESGVTRMRPAGRD